MTLQSDIRTVERSAAFEVSQFMRNEFGLRSTTARANWTQDSLTVTLTEALTPIGQAAAQAAGGDNLLGEAYEALYHLHQNRIHALISQVARRAVRKSSMEMDAKTGRFSLTFFFSSH